MQKQNDADLERALNAHFAPTQADDAAAARVFHALSVSALPPQKKARFATWFDWPSILLDWDFTPAWPRVAAFAVCTGLGFAIGLAGLDAKFDEAAAVTIASADIASLVSDAEPLTGLQP